MAKSVIDVTEDIEFSDIFYVDKDKKVGVNWDEPPARLSISGSVSETLLNVQNVLNVSGSTNLPRVGIGVTAPKYGLDVREQFNLQSGSGASALTGAFLSGSVKTAVLDVQNGVLFVSGSTALPRVAIGKSTANVPLDVLGSVSISGSLLHSGSYTANGPLFISGSIGEYNFNYNNAITMSGSSLGSVGRLGINVGLTDGIDSELQVVGDTFLNGKFNQNNSVYMTGSLAGVPRVSIGKTTSNVPLDVVGTVAVLGSTVLSGSLLQSGSSTFNQGGMLITGSDGTSLLNAANALFVSGSELLPRVGIGQRSPNVALDVFGATTLSGSLVQSGSSTFSGTINLNDSIWSTGSGGIPRLGLGYAATDQALDVKGATVISGSLTQSGSASFVQGPVLITSTNETTRVFDVNSSMVMISGSATTPRIAIGKALSDYPLDVSGSSKFFGPILVTGSDSSAAILTVANKILTVQGSETAPRVAIGKAIGSYPLDVSGSSMFFGPVLVSGSDETVKLLEVSKSILVVSGSESLPRVGIGVADPKAPLHVGGSMILNVGTSGSGTPLAAGELRWAVDPNDKQVWLWLATGSLATSWVRFSGSLSGS